MLVLPNATIEPLNVRKKKNKRSTKCDKSIVTCNVGIAQCEDRTVNMKKKGTTKCDKSTVLTKVLSKVKK